MDSLSVPDVLLFALAAYLAVLALVRMMLAQRGVVTRRVAHEIEEEKRRQTAAAAENAATEKAATEKATAAETGTRKDKPQRKEAA